MMGKNLIMAVLVASCLTATFATPLMRKLLQTTELPEDYLEGGNERVVSHNYYYSCGVFACDLEAH